MKQQRLWFSVGICGFCALFIMSLNAVEEVEPPAQRLEPSLGQIAAPWFPIGMSIGPRDLASAEIVSLLNHQVKQVTIENHLKPSFVQPRRGEFAFAKADQLVNAALAAGKRVHGHALVWHRSSPDWMVQDEAGDPLSVEQAKTNLRHHIAGTLTHYKDRIHSWDVVNEALADGKGEEDFRPSPWYRCLGTEYIVEAFRAAAEAQPEALLFYNDYGLETDPKRSRAVRLIQLLQQRGVRIDGIGLQAHIEVDSPSIADIEESIRIFSQMGLLVHISELDVNQLPWRHPGSDLLEEDRRYEDGLTTAAQQQLSERYRQLFRLFRRHHEVIWAVTFWNTHDGRSWLNDFPVKGRVSHPLLFDRALQPKPAFSAVIEELSQESAP